MSGRPLRIGMLLDVYHPYVSGVTHSVALCRRAMERAGHEVSVFTFGPPSRSDDAGVHRSPGLPIPLRYGATDVRLGLWHAPAQRRRLRAMDVLHVHHPFVSGRLALRYRSGPRQPVVFTSHTRYDLHAGAYLPRWLRAPTRAGIVSQLTRFCGRCDQIFAPTSDMSRRLKAWGVSRPIEVVALGLELERFQDVARRRKVDARRGNGAARHERGEGQRRHVTAVFVGRLGPEKSLRLLLDGYAAVVASRPGFKLIIAGDGPMRGALEDRARSLSIQGSVRFTGLVAYDRVPHLLAQADFFVTPSRSEVQPLSVLEAMAAGLPVLGLDSAGIVAAVEDGVSGIVADGRRSFEAAMGRLVDDAGLRGAMGRAAADASVRYSIGETASHLLTCYERLVACPPGRVHGSLRSTCRHSRSEV